MNNITVRRATIAEKVSVSDRDGRRREGSLTVIAVEHARMIELPGQSLAAHARIRPSSVFVRLREGLTDVLLVLLLVFALPLVILLLGLPLALVIRVIVEIAQRF